VFTPRCLPGVEGGAVLEGAIVVVADVVALHSLAGAVLGCPGDHHLHVVFRVEQIHQEHLEHQRGVRRDLSPCGDGGEPYDESVKDDNIYSIYIFFNRFSMF